MSLAEVEMVFFLPLALLLYWAMPRRAAVQNAVLLLLDCVFYATWSKPWLLWLLASATIDWVVGRHLSRTARPDDADTSAAAATARRTRRRWLWLSLGSNLGVLAACKYLGPSVEVVGDLLQRLGIGSSPETLRILLPLGISYYTLQKLGYVLDVYWGRLPAERSWLRFVVFSSLFAQITAGPISRAGWLLPQLAADRRPRLQQFAAGAQVFLLGYALKALAANQLGSFVVTPVFAAPGQHGLLSTWAGVIGFALQVFSDFAGYSLMAIGVGRWFGLELPQNFNAPFLSRSLPEFWRRWHITLNQWLFEFVYTPLVTSRGSFRGRTLAALWIVFLASGLWHGSQWTFVFWGLLHGFGMVVHQLWDERWKQLCRRDRRFVQRRRSRGYAVASWAVTQAFFVLALIPFRADSLADAGTIAAALLGIGDGSATTLRGLPLHDGFVLLLAFLLPVAVHVAVLPWLSGIGRRIAMVPAPLVGVAYGLVIVALLLFVPVGGSTFIYRNF